MHKYQFYISFNDKINTASSKAIQDCSHILSSLGYRDLTVYTTLTAHKGYLYDIAKNILKLFLFVKPQSIVAIQYPLLSGNAQFKYFIMALRLKKVRFFCVIHDLDELRYNKPNWIGKEAKNLNYYDCVIVHNELMLNWLLKRGVTVPMIPLQMFDYLSEQVTCQSKADQTHQKIVFAGNLGKSNFIYSLSLLNNWCFNVYGPNFSSERAKGVKNLSWKGSFSPEEITNQMEGSFGLIWDGDYLDQLDSAFGNYLKYNSPHKLSLYLAAGLPVIAPVNSAIGNFIKEHKLGILVNNLMELKYIVIDNLRYNLFKRNVLKVSEGIKKGEYFTTAIYKAESVLQGN